jgi:hypothetical protein
MKTILVWLTSEVPEPFLSLLITGLGSVILLLLKPKVKLVWGEKNRFLHLIRATDPNQKKTAIHTAHYIIQNMGRLGAKDVEVVFNYPPTEISVWPQRKYTPETTRENRLIVKFDFIAPREFVEIAVLNLDTDLPDLLNVKCLDGVGKPVQINYHRAYNKFVNFLILGSMFLGVAFVIEHMLVLLLPFIQSLK